MNLYNKYLEKPYSFSVIDTILTSDNLLHLRKNLKKLIMMSEIKNYNIIFVLYHFVIRRRL